MTPEQERILQKCAEADTKFSSGESDIPDIPNKKEETILEEIVEKKDLTKRRHYGKDSFWSESRRLKRKETMKKKLWLGQKIEE